MNSDRRECANISALLPAQVDGTLAAARAAEVERHVSGCPACRTELAGLSGLLDELRGLPPGPPRSDASWGDFSRSVRLSWQRSLDEVETRRASRLRRWLLRLCFGAGTALAVGTAALLLLPRLQPIAMAPTTSSLPSPSARPSVAPQGAAPSTVPQGATAGRPATAAAPGDEAARLEAAGRLGDVLGDPDPDDLLDGLDDHQLEQVGKALAPGA